MIEPGRRLSFRPLPRINPSAISNFLKKKMNREALKTDYDKQSG